jgi:ATP-dependent Lon protease
MEGKGNLQMTGQIGEIMQESAQAALSYLKSKQETFQIPTDFFEDMDIHIHVPEGSIPKDGPSAVSPWLPPSPQLCWACQSGTTWL